MPYKQLLFLLFLFSGLGFIDATYLTLQYYQGSIPTCALVRGCDVVLTSEWATLGPVPIALVGAIYYLTVFGLGLAYLDTKQLRVLSAASVFTSAGWLVSVGLISLQAFVIQAWCFYCLVSALISTLLFAVGLALFWFLKGDAQSAEKAKAP